LDDPAARQIGTLRPRPGAGLSARRHGPVDVRQPPPPRRHCAAVRVFAGAAFDVIILGEYGEEAGVRRK
jgi:hypothetical protein